MPQAPPVRQHRLVFVGLLAAACCSLPQSCSLHAHSRSFPLACRMQARCSSSKCLVLVAAGRDGNGACVESAIVWRGAPVCACTCDGRLRPGCVGRGGSVCSAVRPLVLTPPHSAVVWLVRVSESVREQSWSWCACCCIVLCDRARCACGDVCRPVMRALASNSVAKASCS